MTMNVWTAGAATVLLAAGTVVAGSAAAQAAVPTCNNRTLRHGLLQDPLSGHLYFGEAGVPSYGPGGTVFDCVLPLNTNSGTDSVTSPVVWLQFDLNKCYGAGLTIDGVYGPRTKAAVAAAQKTVPGVTADGIYGPQTRNAIGWWTEVRVSKTGATVHDCLPYSSLQ